MRNCFSPATETGRSFGMPALLAVVVFVGLAGAALRAHSPANDSPGNKHYTRDAIFHLPIQIEEKSRGNIKEVLLYVKVGQGPWQLKEKAPPSQPAFKYKAPQDGEYWFTLVTVNNKDIATPGDLAQLVPADIVMVVVDTERPVFDLQVQKVASGDLLRCVITDANPDYKAVKITYHGSDQVIHVLEPLPDQPGVFRVPGPDVLVHPLEVSVTDLAGNTTAREVLLSDGVVKVPTTPGPVLPPAPPPAPPPSQVVQAGGPEKIAPAGPPVVQTNSSGAASPASVGPASNNAAPHSVDNGPVAVPPPPVQLPAHNGVPHQLINTTRASLDYRIEQVGPSGIGKVEVWLTSDNGTSWQLRSENTERRSPAEFDLPGEGLYGVRLVITNGNGFGGRAPLPGEQPQCWIEVDTSAPVVQLRDVEPVTNGGTIDIRWVVNDKNLGAEPINLYFGTRKEGPWQPMAHGLKNDGLYHWTFPRDLGSQFFVRIEATDLAGNVGRVDSPTAVVLDMTEPRASVIGVSGVSGVHGTVTPPRSN